MVSILIQKLVLLRPIRIAGIPPSIIGVLHPLILYSLWRSIARGDFRLSTVGLCVARRQEFETLGHGQGEMVGGVVPSASCRRYSAGSCVRPLSPLYDVQWIVECGTCKSRESLRAQGDGVLANVDGASGCNLVGPMAGTSDKVFGHRN